MLQLNNKTPFEAEITITPDKTGSEVLILIVKATFSLTSPLRIAEKQIPVTLADEYWDKPDASSLKYASDIVLSKPGTDVALVGQAWVPDGQTAQVMDTMVTIGEQQKIVRVYGDRWFTKSIMGLRMTDPEPFQSVPLVWERAFGGRCLVNKDKNKFIAEERNPVGLGLNAKEESQDLEGQPAPNLEDPSHPYNGLSKKGVPAGYGFIAPWWLPRRSFAGTYDEIWKKTRMPLLPEDFNDRFFCAASSGLFFERYLEGGEPVSLLNVCAVGPLEFSLPRCSLKADIEIKGEKQYPSFVCHTVLFEPDEKTVSMTWHSALLTGNSPHNVGEIEISLEKLEGIAD